MADQFPTSQTPRRSLSPQRFAQSLRPQPFQSLLDDQGAPQMFNMTPPGVMAPTPSLRTSSPMRFAANPDVNGVGSSSPMGGGRGGPQTPTAFTAPTHPASTGAMPEPDYAGITAEGLRKHQVGNVSGAQFNAASPTSNAGDIQYDKATNTFSNAAGREMPLFSSPGAGGAGGTPGHPTAQTMATMDNLVSRQPGALPHQMQVDNLANGVGANGNLTTMAQGNTAPNASQFSSKFLTVGLRNGGNVPGQGQGDKVPAMLEPEEFVVSNAMMQEEPGLRGKLSKLRSKVLAEKGENDQDADDKALRNGVVHAADGGSVWDKIKGGLGMGEAAPAAPATPGTSLVPVAGTGDNGYRPNFTMGDAPTPGATGEPIPINPRTMGDKFRDLGDLTLRKMKGMPGPTGVGEAAGNAVKDLGAQAGRLVKANAGKVLGRATNAFGAAGHYDAYGPNSPLSLSEQLQLGGQDALRYGAATLGGLAGGGFGGALAGPVGAFAGGTAGSIYADSKAHELANKFIGGDKILTDHHMDPDRTVFGAVADALKGKPGQAQAAAPAVAQPAAAEPTLRTPAADPNATPVPSRLPGMVNPADSDVAQKYQGTARDAALADQMESDRLRSERGDPRALLMAQAQQSIAQNGGMTKGASQALQSLAGNDVNLEGHRMTLRNSMISKQIAAERLREEMRQHGIENDRADRKFGYEQGQDLFKNNESATKAYGEQLGTKYQTRDPETGKQVVDAQKVSDHMQGAQEYINQAAKNLRAQGNEAGAARVLQQGFAGLDDKHKAIIDQGMAMKNIVRANKGILPGSATFKDDPNPAMYAIDPTRSDSSTYVLQNGARVPRYLVDGGASILHPSTWIGNPQSNNFTSIGQEPSLR